VCPKTFNVPTGVWGLMSERKRMKMNMFKKNIYINSVPEYSDWLNPHIQTGVRHIYNKVWDMKKIVTFGGVFAVVLALLVTTAMFAFRGGNDAAAVVDLNTTTTVVEQNITTTTTVANRAQYVCDMPRSTSTEYEFIKWSNGSVAYPDFPAVTAKTIVFTWHVDLSVEVRNIFAKNITDVGIYVGKEMRIENADYVASNGELIVPVVNGSNIKMFADGDYLAAIWTRNSFLFGVESSFVLNDTHSDLETHMRLSGTRIIYHELGHLFGLDHTHVDDDGIQQRDSIMSYEWIWSAKGFETGDIAGLQEIFCK
jgi:hypothetical protein